MIDPPRILEFFANGVNRRKRAESWQFRLRLQMATGLPLGNMHAIVP